MSLFDQYACLDYNGARSRTQQRKHIVLAITALKHKQFRIVTKKDRDEIRIYLFHIFVKASQNRQRILLGIDHNFGFPLGFYEVLTGYPLHTWRQWLDLIQFSPLSLSVGDNDPRIWAEMINRLIQQKLGTACGPFWGPGFSVIKRPDFDYGVAPFRERRLIEKQIPKTQPVFKLGGAGAVGLQTLYGIFQLAVLNDRLLQEGIHLFFWPFDGFEPPHDRHVIVELYPGIINRGIKSDRNDAVSGACWLKNADSNNKLSDFFHFNGQHQIMSMIRAEGWIPGIPFPE